MDTIIKGHAVKWSGSDCDVIEADVMLGASQAVGVWLVDGAGDEGPFRMIVGARTKEDAARAYAKHRKDYRHVPPTVFRVFPLANLEPISLAGVVDEDGDADWSAFQNAWVEVRL